MRGSWKPKKTATYWTSNFSGYHSLSFPLSWLLIPASYLQLIWGSELQLLNRGPEGPHLLGAGSLYRILSPTHLRLWNPTAESGVLKAPSAGYWFSLGHLISNSSEALNSNCSIGGPEGPLCWVLILSTASLLQLTRTSSAPSYIIVLHPLNSIRWQSRLSPDNLNRMHRVILLFFAQSILPFDSQSHHLTSSTRCTCYLHRCISYFDSLAGLEVNIQQ